MTGCHLESNIDLLKRQIKHLDNEKTIEKFPKQPIKRQLIMKMQDQYLI